MHSVNLAFFLTLVGVAFGMTTVLAFIPRAALGPGFGKTIAAIVFFCLLGPILLAGRLLPPADAALTAGVRLAGWCALVAFFVYFVVMNYPGRERAQRALVAIAWSSLAATIATTGLLLGERFFRNPSAMDAAGLIPLRTAALTIGVYASGLLTGAVTMAMLIGHWYLVIPGLAIQWLKGACVAFGAAIGVKAISIALSFAVGAMSHRWGARGFYDFFYAEVFQIFAVRAFVGLVVPACFAVMAYRAAAIRSTQSSTGILFPAMIVVFIGEMIAASLIAGLNGLAI